MPDDAFYYFTLARNLASGHGFVISADSVATTGFQPLWGAGLGLINALVGGLPHEPLIVLAQSIGAALGMLSGVLLLELILRLSDRRDVALVAVGSFLLSPQIVKHHLNGMETSLAILAVLVLNLLILDAAVDKRGSRPLLFLGFAGGLGILARVDIGLLLIGGLGISALPFLRGVRSGLRGLVLAVGIIIPLLPWMVLGWQTGSGILPESGTAIRNLTLMVRHLPILSPLASVSQASDIFIPFYFQNALEFISAWVRQVPLFYPVTMPIFALTSIETATQLTAFLGVLLATISFFAVAKYGEPKAKTLTLMWGSWALMMLIAYALFIQAPWFYQRYAAPLGVVFNLVAIITLSSIASRTRIRAAIMPAAGVMILIGFMLLIWRGSYRWMAFEEIADDGFYRTAKFINAELPSSARVGVFSAGLIGYYADKPVVALDGKVNEGARKALAAGEMFAFICDRDIDYVADWEKMITSLLVRRSKDWDDANLQLVHPVEVAEYNDIMIYEVNQENCEGG